MSFRGKLSERRKIREERHKKRKNSSAKNMENLFWWSEIIYHLSMFTRIRLFAAIKVHLFIFYYLLFGWTKQKALM